MANSIFAVNKLLVNSNYVTKKEQTQTHYIFFLLIAISWKKQNKELFNNYTIQWITLFPGNFAEYESERM